jgi:wyosine [tRNA(Phe)-imidazoG37] synthetase (radical SAM superfamily)
MNYVFGPVPSRRLGKSLGIDPIPLKTCNWNCVYCQLGRTRPLTNTRRGYNPRENILAEVQQALAVHQPGEIDWVTFVGSGEPTLHSGLGWLIRQVKALANLPVAVITNGALLSLPEVRTELVAADAVLPSLDAGNLRLYRKINRPWPKLTFEAHLEGLAAFRRVYTGQLWIEVMLMKGLNDTEEALQEIATVLKEICPDQIHVLLPVRPPAESWVQPADEAGLQKANSILGKVTHVVQPVIGQTVTHSTDDLESALLGIITRHPMQEKELSATLNKWSPDEVHNALEVLLVAGKVQVIERFERRFWSSAGSFYERK